MTQKYKIGRKVREIRKEKKLTQEELSFRANISRPYIGMVERGERNITMKFLSKIADALQTPLENFFY